MLSFPPSFLLIGLFISSVLIFPIITCHSRDNVTDDFLREGWMTWDMDNNGLIHIVWNQKTGSGRNYLYYCNYDPVSGNTSPHVKVGATGGHRDSTTPDIAVSQSSNICHIVWSAQPYDEYIPPGEDWSEKRKIMYVRRYPNNIWDST